MLAISLSRVVGWKICRVWLKTGMFGWVDNTNWHNNRVYASYVSDHPTWRDYIKVFEKLEEAESLLPLLQSQWAGTRFLVVPVIHHENTYDQHRITTVIEPYTVC